MFHPTPLTAPNHHEDIEALQQDKLIAIIRTSTADEAAWMAQQAVEAGVRWIEFTWNTPEAATLLARFASQYPHLHWGAGTITSRQAAIEAIDAGASFLVSPITDIDWIGGLRQSHPEVMLIPGASTPTEIWNAYEAGAHLVKVFPASPLGGATYIQAIRGPLPDIPLVVTGNVQPQEIEDYLRAGVTGIGIGHALWGGKNEVSQQDTLTAKTALTQALSLAQKALK